MEHGTAYANIRPLSDPRAQYPPTSPSNPRPLLTPRPRLPTITRGPIVAAPPGRIALVRMTRDPLRRDGVRPRTHDAVSAVDARLEPLDALAPVGDAGAGRQLAGVEAPARVDVGGMVVGGMDVRGGVCGCREGEGGEGEDCGEAHCRYRCFGVLAWECDL